MRSGDVVLGPDGTVYVIVRARDVAADQFRWWITPSWARARAGDLDTPDEPGELHLEPPGEHGASKALVLPL